MSFYQYVNEDNCLNFTFVIFDYHHSTSISPQYHLSITSISPQYHLSITSNSVSNNGIYTSFYLFLFYKILITIPLKITFYFASILAMNQKINQTKHFKTKNDKNELDK